MVLWVPDWQKLAIKGGFRWFFSPRRVRKSGFWADFDQLWYMSGYDWSGNPSNQLKTLNKGSMGATLAGINLLEPILGAF